MQRGCVSKFAKLSGSVIAMTSVLTADAVWAQSSVEDEIIVTARRVGETLIEAPVAVSAFDSAKIEDLGLRNVDDLARHTAGFSFSNAFGRTTERPVIRGAANILAGVQFGVEAGAAYFIDGVYYSGDLQALDLRAMEQAEVIKGPQSALYGRNTYSGAINFTTRRPSKAGKEGSFEATVAEDGELEAYARISTSFAEDQAGFSLSGRYYTYGGDGAWENGVDGTQLGKEESLNLNAVLDVNFNDSASLVTRAGYVKDNDGPRPFALIGAEQNNCFPGYRSGAFYDVNGGFPFPPPNPANRFPATTTTDSNFQYFCGDLSQFEDIAPTQDLNGTPFVGVERDMFFGTALFEYDFENGMNLALSAGYRDQELLTGSDSDHQAGGINFIAISPFFTIPTADAFLNTTGQGDRDDISLEARLNSDSASAFRWSVGGYYYDSNDEGRAGSLGRVTANDSLGLELDTINTIENKAIFGTAGFDVSEQLEISLEARYQEETKGRQEFGGTRTPTYDEDKKFNDFVYKGILSYDINDNYSAYASYAKGVKPGGVNGSIGAPTGDEFYEPEEVKAIELGLKGRLGDAGRFSLSGFYNDITQYQLTTPVASVGSGNVNSVATNQGDAEVKGIELETSYDLTENFTIGGTYAWTDAEFTSGCDDFQFTLNTGGFLLAPIDRTNPPSTGLIRNPADPSGAGLSAPLTDPAGLFTGNLSCSIAGNKIPMTSEHQASLYGQFETALNDEWNMFLNLDFTHESSKFVQVHNGMETGDTNMLGARAGLTYKGAKFEIFARNLTDERTPPIATRWFDLLEGYNTVSAGFAGAGRGSIDRSLVGPRSTFLSFRRGRQFGARIKYDF